MRKQDKIEELESDLEVKREELEVLESHLESELTDCNVDVSINEYSSKDELVSYVDDNYLCNEEVIYYSVAMEYLTENDTSLNESLEIAEEYGFTPSSLSSEILAGLLKTRENEQNFSEIDFDEYFDLKEEIESLQSDLEELTEEV